jgi:phosphohistidine phosphatase
MAVTGRGVPRERMLLLMRHGHAENHHDDRQRPLSAQGRTAARSTGTALREKGLITERILSSGALRARQTAELVAEAWDDPVPIEIEPSLYLATSEQIRAALGRVQAGVASLLLVGHNPGLSAFARELGAHGCTLSPAEYALLRPELDDWSKL